MRIGVDAMGGDNAPEVVVRGAIEAAGLLASDSVIVLYGIKSEIEKYMPEGEVAGIEIVECSEVIEMGAHPAEAFVKKPDSSIVRAFGDLAKGKLDGFASAGSTGAMMVGSMYAIKVIEGIARPTIAAHYISRVKGQKVTIVDVGLNADSKPETLCENAIMGSIYSESICEVENPKVALLNIGSEEGKGNLMAKATYKLLKELKGINFVGNIEGKDMLAGEVADVVVCDGFIGNIMLKLMESMYDNLLADGIRLDYVDSMNYEITGGTPVLGINSTVVIGHGASSQRAIVNMILATQKAISAGLPAKFRKAFN